MLHWSFIWIIYITALIDIWVIHLVALFRVSINWHYCYLCGTFTIRPLRVVVTFVSFVCCSERLNFVGVFTLICSVWGVWILTGVFVVWAVWRLFLGVAAVFGVLLSISVLLTVFDTLVEALWFCFGIITVFSGVLGVSGNFTGLRSTQLRR